MVTRSYVCVDCSAPGTVTTVRGAVPRRCGPCRAIWSAAQTAKFRHKYAEQNRTEAAKRQRREREAGRLIDATERERQSQLNWARHLRRVYGITEDDYNEMFEQQGGVCAICSKSGDGGARAASRLNVDHDHETGRIRQLLCSKCNTAVGLLDDDADRALAMAFYLERHAMKSRDRTGA